MYPILVDLGTVEVGGLTIPVVIGGYGLMFSLAAVCGWLLYRHLGRQIDPRVPWTDVYFAVAVAGFVGAKIANAIVFLPEIAAGRATWAGVLRGGGIWLGGVLLAYVTWYALMRKYSVPIGHAVNAVFVVVPMVHAIGRIGCIFGGCCYGSACDLSWAITYTEPLAHELNGTPLHVPVHPTALYESGLEVGNFLLCYALWRKKVPKWTICATWSALYGAERFLVEFFRGDLRGSYGWLSTGQWMSLGLVLTSLFVIEALIRRTSPASRQTARAR